MRPARYTPLLLTSLLVFLIAGTAPIVPAAAGDVADLPLEVKIGQMLMAGVDGQTLSDDARYVIGTLHVGNVVLMGRNVDSPAQVLELTRGLQAVALDAHQLGLLISTDQEGGLVQRLRFVDGFTALPAAATVGAARRPDLIRAYGRMVGEEMLAVGVNMDLAPVLDVNDNPLNPVIGPRSFGATPEAVEAAGLAFMAGLHDAGAIATAKHFPGHGNTSADSHLELPFVRKDRDALDQVELRPFHSAVANGIDAVMLAHVAYPALDPSGLPATVSAPIVGGVLRADLGFNGVVVTDDMGMQGITSLYSTEEAAVRSVLAGADVVLCARLDLAQACKPAMLEQLRAGLLQAVADGRLPVDRVDQSVRRILDLKARYRVGPGTGEGLAAVGGAAHLRTVAEVLEAAGRP